MDLETGSQARSTLAAALYCPAKVTDITCPGDSSNESNVPVAPVDQGPAPFSGTSGAIIEQCFTETTSICLDPGYPTVALNQD